MNISNLYEGQIIKSYRELCKILEIKVSGGSTKISQINNLKKYCDFHRDKNKYIIDKIYKDDELIKHQLKFRKYKNFLVNEEDENKTGVYIIKLNNQVYIGSTIKGFKYRFLKHIEKGKDTKEILLKGAEFKILWISPTIDEYIIREIENIYINSLKEMPEYQIINKRNSWSMINNPKVKRSKMKRILVSKKNYKKAVELLKNSGLL